LGQGEQGVEGGDAVDVGRRHLEPAGDLVDGAPTDPPHGVVDGVQRRQEQVAPLAESAVAPPRLQGRAEEVVEGRLLRRTRRQSREPEVHERRS
jgi:hypothetical protein